MFSPYTVDNEPLCTSEFTSSKLLNLIDAINSRLRVCIWWIHTRNVQIDFLVPSHRSCWWPDGRLWPSPVSPSSLPPPVRPWNVPSHDHAVVKRENENVHARLLHKFKNDLQWKRVSLRPSKINLLVYHPSPSQISMPGLRLILKFQVNDIHFMNVPALLEFYWLISHDLIFILLSLEIANYIVVIALQGTRYGGGSSFIPSVILYWYWVI